MALKSSYLVGSWANDRNNALASPWRHLTNYLGRYVVTVIDNSRPYLHLVKDNFRVHDFTHCLASPQTDARRYRHETSPRPTRRMASTVGTTGNWERVTASTATDGSNNDTRQNKFQRPNFLASISWLTLPQKLWPRKVSGFGLILPLLCHDMIIFPPSHQILATLHKCIASWPSKNGPFCCDRGGTSTCRSSTARSRCLHTFRNAWYVSAFRSVADMYT